MSIIIPAGNCLVVMVGPSGGGKSTFCSKFNPAEVVSSDALRIELTGQQERQDKNALVFEEFHRRIEARLNAGLRVVADATHLNAGDRKRTAQIGLDRGVPVHYVVVNRPLISKMKTAGWRENVRVGSASLIEAHDAKYVQALPEIKRGDGLNLAGIHFVENQKVTVVPHMTDILLHKDGLFGYLVALGYKKLRVIGDIHGNLKGFLEAIDVDEDTFLLFLGDILDYGDDSLYTVAEVEEMIARGRAASIRGNHEKKVLKFILDMRNKGEYKGRLSHGNEATINRLKALAPEHRLKWEAQLISLVDSSPDWIEVDRFLFTHGAGHPHMWGNKLFRAHQNSMIESYALYGETDGTKGDDGYPTRLYNWIDEIPNGKVVIVGHAIRSVEPMTVSGKLGGRAIFLDTGSSKDISAVDGAKPGQMGKVSWLDFEINKFGLVQIGFGSEKISD